MLAEVGLTVFPLWGESIVARQPRRFSITQCRSTRLHVLMTGATLSCDVRHGFSCQVVRHCCCVSWPEQFRQNLHGRPGTSKPLRVGLRGVIIDCLWIKRAWQLPFFMRDRPQ